MQFANPAFFVRKITYVFLRSFLYKNFYKININGIKRKTMDKKIKFDNEMNKFQLKNTNKKYKIGKIAKIEPKI